MNFVLDRPAYATSKLLDQCGLTLNDIDVFEFHEAFAVISSLSDHRALVLLITLLFLSGSNLG